MAAIQAGLTSGEAAEWMASIRLDPDDADRADIRHALTMHLLMQLLSRRKRGQKLPSVRDFLADLPWRSEHQPARPQTRAELRAKIDATMRMLGGRQQRG